MSHAEGHKVSIAWFKHAAEDAAGKVLPPLLFYPAMLYSIYLDRRPVCGGTSSPSTLMWYFQNKIYRPYDVCILYEYYFMVYLYTTVSV